MKIIKLQLLGFAFVILPTSIVFAQGAASTDSVVYGWSKAVVGNLNLTQASFDNWQQGGESTLAWPTKEATGRIFPVTRKRLKYACSQLSALD